MKLKNIILTSSIIIGLSVSVSGQDIHFSMFSQAPSSINPALAGVTYETRVIANYKTQWSSVANKYETMAISFDQTIKHKKLKGNYFAVAANIYKDVAGDAKMGSLNPNLGIAYLQKISKKMKLSGGVQSGFFYRTIDASNLRWDGNYNGYSYDPTRPSGEPNPPRSGFSSFDIGGGVNLNFIKADKYISAKNAAKFDAGFAAYHYSLGKNSFLNSDEKLKTRMCAYFNGDFNIPGTINNIMPSVLYMRQGPSTEVVAGALFKFVVGDQSTYTSLKKSRSFSIGGYYRYRDAIIPTFMFQYSTYALGMAYDINVSALTPASKRNGGLEVMLRYNVFGGYGVNMGRTDTKPSY